MAGPTLDLRVLIKAQDQATAVFRKVAGEGEDFAKRAQGIGLVMAGAGAAITGGFLASANSIGNAGEELLRVSKISGVAVDKLSALKFAAEQNEVPFETMATGLRFLQRNAANAAQGTGPAVEGFKQLGISVTDAGGKVKDADALLMEVSEALKNTSSDAERTRLAMLLMGRGGAASLPLLVQGADAISAAMQEAKEKGLVWSEEQAKAADDWNDSMSALKASMGGFLKSAVIPTMEALQPLLETTGKISGAVAVWADEHPRLAAGIGLTTVALGGIMTVVGPILYVLPQVSAGLSIVTGWFKAKGTAATVAGVEEVVASERAVVALNAEAVAAERAAGAYGAKGAAAGAAGVTGGTAATIGVVIGGTILAGLKAGQVAFRARDFRTDMERAKTPEQKAARQLEEVRWMQNDPAANLLLGDRRKEQLGDAEEVLSRKAYGLTAEQSRWMEQQKVGREREGRIQRQMSPVLGRGGGLSALRPKETTIIPQLGMAQHSAGGAPGAGGAQIVNLNVSGNIGPNLRQWMESPEGQRAFGQWLKTGQRTQAYQGRPMP